MSASLEVEEFLQLLAEYDLGMLPDPEPSSTLNHGGPGICRLCYPNGAPTQRAPALQPQQQGELAL